MSNAVAIQGQTLGKIEQVLINGDLSRLSEGERLQYYRAVCESVGLNMLTKPFDYITLNGKLTLYARKDATDQLRNNRKVSIKIVDRQQIGDVYVVTAEASIGDRTDSSTGAVSVSSLKGEALANAFMKAETKAKRRVTLSICGLGLLDETEVESIPASDRGGVGPQQPAPGDGNQEPTHYKIPFGKWAQRTIEEVCRNHGPDAIADYMDYLTNSAQKQNKPIQGQVKEFIDNATVFLRAFEQEASAPLLREMGDDS